MNQTNEAITTFHEAAGAIMPRLQKATHRYHGEADGGFCENLEDCSSEEHVLDLLSENWKIEQTPDPHVALALQLRQIDINDGEFAEVYEKKRLLQRIRDAGIMIPTQTGWPKHIESDARAAEDIFEYNALIETRPIEGTDELELARFMEPYQSIIDELIAAGNNGIRAIMLVLLKPIMQIEPFSWDSTKVLFEILNKMSKETMHRKAMLTLAIAPLVDLQFEARKNLVELVDDDIPILHKILIRFTSDEDPDLRTHPGAYISFILWAQKHDGTHPMNEECLELRLIREEDVFRIHALWFAFHRGKNGTPDEQAQALSLADSFQGRMFISWVCDIDDCEEDPIWEPTVTAIGEAMHENPNICTQYDWYFQPSFYQQAAAKRQ